MRTARLTRGEKRWSNGKWEDRGQEGSLLLLAAAGCRASRTYARLCAVGLWLDAARASEKETTSWASSSAISNPQEMQELGFAVGRAPSRAVFSASTHSTGPARSSCGTAVGIDAKGVQAPLMGRCPDVTSTSRPPPTRASLPPVREIQVEQSHCYETMRGFTNADCTAGSPEPETGNRQLTQHEEHAGMESVRPALSMHELFAREYSMVRKTLFQELARLPASTVPPPVSHFAWR